VEVDKTLWVVYVSEKEEIGKGKWITEAEKIENLSESNIFVTYPIREFLDLP